MKKYLKYAILPTMALALIGAGVASAHGFFWGNIQDPQAFAQSQTQMFQKQADLLGISVDELKNDWAQGKTFQQIAQEKGITQDQLKTKMQDLMKQKMKDDLQVLVQQGVITQAQADQRLQYLQNRPQDGNRGRGMMRGFHHGWGL